jgi:hypothetical protein
MMTLWAVTTDLQIHLGDIVATVTCAAMLWMANNLYRLVKGFFSRMHDYAQLVDQHQQALSTTKEIIEDQGERLVHQDGRLEDVELMIDRHSRSLTKWEPLDGPVEALYRRRRRGDARGLEEGIG